MCRERIIFRIAGSLILLGVILGYYVSPYWLILDAFVGVNMLQSSFTGFCPMTLILKAMKIEACSGSAQLT
ncbi:MAG: DUF2892 domain-containing protein [Planctomycetales bacterium]|nr:DUF2892 domain-containing protein [bacterium]UNM08700.1 MAG: DUF2892 domain-containing protein [Planctomycetales bacterium]